MRVLLDMDEVLVDFVSGACHAFGTTREQVLAHWERGRWDMVPPLGRALGYPPERPMTDVDFWYGIERTYRFWERLQPHPWWRELVSLVERYTRDWHIVTAPSKCPTCYDGKVRWLKRHFGHDFDRFAITPHKEIFAGPRVVLIDDRWENTFKFVNSGGWGIVFPAYHNPYWESVARPLEFVEEYLREVQKNLHYANFVLPRPTVAIFPNHGGASACSLPTEG